MQAIVLEISNVMLLCLELFFMIFYDVNYCMLTSFYSLNYTADISVNFV